MTSPDVPGERSPMPDLAPLTGRLQQMSDRVGRAARPIGIAGVGATVVIGLALYPWVMHETGTKVIAVVLVVVGLAASLRLLWHQRALARTIGNPAYIDDAVHKLATHAPERARAAATAARGAEAASRRSRVFGVVREMRALRDVAEVVEDLVSALSPPALILSVWAAGITAATIVLSVPIALVSIIALLLR